MVSKIALVFTLFVMVSQADGMTYQKAYQLIAEQGESLRYSSRDHGALCEVLAVEKMKEIFPRAIIESGIKYGPEGGNTMGELDVVMFENGYANMIIEVKCMKNYGSASSKAEGQLNRFAAVAGRCDFDYWDSYESFSCDEFQGSNKSYHKMSYLDAQRYGFDLSFDLTRDDILRLIDDLSR